MSNTPEKAFNIRNNFVEGKYARSNKVNFMNFNKANFMNFNIPTSNRFDIYIQLKILKMTLDDIIEIDIAKARKSPFVKSSKSTLKKRPDVVINKNPENQHIFGKENINVKRRQETYADAVHGNIKQDTRKIIMFTDSIPRAIWMRKLISAQMEYPV